MRKRIVKYNGERVYLRDLIKNKEINIHNIAIRTIKERIESGMKPEVAFQMPKLKTGRKRTKDEEEYVDEVHPELLRAMREENCNEFLRIAEKYGRKNDST